MTLEKSRIHLVVSDDENLFREMLVGMLNRQEDFEVVAEGRNGTEAVEKILRHRPDVAILDIDMPGLSGLQVIEKVRREWPEARLIMLTGYPKDEYIFEALQMGASGFVTKSSPGQKIAEAVRIVHSGESILEPEITTKLIQRYFRRPPGKAHAGSTPPRTAKQELLSPRETEILALIAAGRDNRGIAGALDISVNTVKKHVGSLFRKIGVSDRIQAIFYATDKGIR